ncbi:oxidoreductase [Amycolatopsis antarctica]|uniref:Oxidoreductase n=1 Tax=Amycolatopsis antarctica TaxID=1854586 RepID=A0A263CYB3_9PSEU|nr:oxidoreductase [Amycolatopsis antarctica]OZM71142.1 oxidoreductase [Amycolatopsis antarctica]
MDRHGPSAADMPDLHGRTVVVTGANSGVGLGTATLFARAGAHVVLAVRDARRGEEAAREIGGSPEVRRLDLADLASVRAFAAAWDGEIAVLVNNAGVAMVPESRTADGFETQFGTNHLGPFALTNLLLPHVTGRVVTLSSGAHRAGTIHFDDLDLRAGGYGLVKAYGQSKLANLLFTLELQRRLEETGSAVRALAAHPGYAATNLGTKGRNRFLVAGVHLAGRFFAQTREQAALPTVFAATRDLPGASYVGPDGRFELHGKPALVGRSAEASDPAVARRLWDVSEGLTGVTYGLG